jgi:hypothetical protein
MFKYEVYYRDNGRTMATYEGEPITIVPRKDEMIEINGILYTVISVLWKLDDDRVRVVINIKTV